MNNPQQEAKLLDFISGLGALLAAMGTMPIDSADLPMPENWRPYIISVGFLAVTASKWLKIATSIFIKWREFGKEI